MGSVYRRRVRLVSDDGAAPARGGSVVAEMEDDFHHFRVDLEHDGTAVVAVSGTAIRYPWTTCPGATAELTALKGMPLSRSSTAVGSFAAPRRNCTHLFDLAGLAVAHAASGRKQRVYDVEVPARAGGRTDPLLLRDGELVLSWSVQGLEITGPAPFAGIPLRGGRGFLSWAAEHLDEESMEAAVVLRRSVEIAWGREQDLDSMERASDLGDFMLGACFTFQPGTAEVAIRMKGSTRDFSAAPAALLAGPTS